MKLDEYQQETTRTWKHLHWMDIAHMLFGMGGEFKELYDATDNVNRAEELVDIQWYVSNYCNLYGIQLHKIFEFKPNLIYYKLEKEDYIVRLQCEISDLIDLEKKRLIYGKLITHEEVVELVITVAKRLNDCYSYYDINPYQAMENNIAKLRARYPNAFTEYDALNRDLKKEREALEK